jgi:hypothetical protein
MSDIIGAALGSVNATITILKGLTALNRQYAEAELRGKVVDALERATEARAAILALQEQNKDLQEKLTRRATMRWIPPVYWQTREGQPNDGPFCPQCWDSEEKVIRLQPLQAGAWVCKTCGHVFGDS